MDVRRFHVDLFIVLLVLLIRNASTDYFEDVEDETPSWSRCPWIRNKLMNGRVKIRSRGRIAKFLCDPGYELVGKRFATCVRGLWNNPLPFCVSRGCHKLPDIPNGRVTEMHRGARLVYDCLPGYVLDGVASVYCDGRRWSTEPPSCVVAISDPKTSCDFEDPDLCGWTQDPRHDFDWRRHQFATPSGHVGTGPSFDHTFGEGKGGFYLYGEASSPRKVNDTSRLFSPVYTWHLSGGCFVFWYHMYGSTTGGLRVYMKPESHVFGEFPPSWEKWGNQGNQWFRGNISIPNLEENFQIVIEGIRGSSYIGDTAIDDVFLTTNDCESIENSTQPTAEWTADSCRGRCREPNEGLSCGCNEDCYAAANCCNDYMIICTGSNETIENDNPEEWAVTKLPATQYISYSEDSEAIMTSITNLPTLENISVTSTSSFLTASNTTLTTSPTQTASILMTTNSTHIADILKTINSTQTANILNTTSSTHTPSTTQTTTSTLSTSAMPYTSITTLKTITLSTMISLVTSPLLPATENATQTLTEIKVTNETVTSLPAVTTPVINTVDSIAVSVAESTRKTYNLRPRTQKTSTPIPLMISTNPSIRNSTIENKGSSSMHSSFQSSLGTEEESSKASKPAEISSSQKEFNVDNITLPATLSSTPLVSTISAEPVTKSETVRGALSTTHLNIITSEKSTTTVLPVTYSTSSPNTQTAASTILSVNPLITSTSTHLTSRRRFFIPSTLRSISFPRTVVATIGTTKVKYHTIRTTGSTSLPHEMTEPVLEHFHTHASKAASKASDNSQPTITIISVTVVVVLCLAGGIIYYLKKQKIRKQSKLSDDSEMRFLSDNEIIEYSDSSALDKILTHER